MHGLLMHDIFQMNRNECCRNKESWNLSLPAEIYRIVYPAALLAIRKTDTTGSINTFILHEQQYICHNEKAAL